MPDIAAIAFDLPYLAMDANAERVLAQLDSQALKQAAATPVERATIEIVALLFQSILTEDRIPASVRVFT